MDFSEVGRSLATGAKWMLPLLLRNETDGNWLGTRKEFATVPPIDRSTEAPASKTLVVPADRMITVEELMAHNVPGEAWFAIRGKVYDLTTFARKHPGGKDILYVSAGRDVTQMFEATHEAAQEMILRKHLIGNLSGNELPTFPMPGLFAKTLRQRVKDYFVNAKLDKKAGNSIFARYVIIMIGLLASYTALYFSKTVASSSALFVTAAVVAGFFQALYGMYMLHDGSHSCQTHNPTFWKLMMSGHDLFLGLSHTAWVIQHVVGHHCYTNVEGADPDIDTNDVDFRRIKETQIWRPFYALQHLYAPLVYCFLGIKSRIQDFTVLFISKMQGPIRVNPLTTEQSVIFWAGKAFFVTHRFVIPFLYSPLTPLAVIGAFIMSDFVFSWYLALIFQANHVVEEVSWPLPDANNVVQMDWAQMQIETAQDYGHGSWANTVLSGGLNYQTVHHLFPNISQEHYPAIAPIVKQTCQEFGVRYLIRDGFMEAFGGHVGLLKFLGSGEAAFGHRPHDHEHDE